MSVLKTAVLRQISYARSVRSVIRAIMRRMLDGEWIDRIFASSDEEFNNRLDVALKSLDLRTATKRDFCEAVVGVLCDEISELCQALKEVCEGSGYSDYFKSHISHERFVRLVLSVDTVKLGKMKKILEDARLSPIDILRNIGAVLNDEALEERASLGARERRHANAELKAIAADVKKTMQAGFAQTNRKLDECKDSVADVGAKVDAVDKKVAKLRKNGKPRGRYTKEARALCWSCWIAAANHEEVWRSVNTRITCEAVFKFYQGRLTKCGVNDYNEFRSIIRAEEKRRNRELQAKQDEARQKSAAQTPTKRGKNGIMSEMKGHAKSALALTLAIAGGLAAPLRSDAALDPTTAQNGVASNEARAEVRGCVVRVAGGRRGISSNGADRITSTVEQEYHNGLTLAPTVYITPTEDSLRFRKCGNVIGRPWYGKESPHCRYRKVLDG